MLNTSRPTHSCMNFLSGRLELSEVQSLIGGVLSLTLSPATIFTNIILIVNLQKIKQIPNPSRTFLLFLSYSDCCIGGIVLPMFALTLIFYSNESNCALEMVTQFIAGFFCGISGRITGFIALDRYMHIKYFFMHQKLNTNKRYRILICVASVIGSLVASSLTNIGTRFGFYKEVSGVLISFDTLTLGGSIILYLAAYRSIRNHVRNSVVWNSDNQVRRRPKYDLVMAKTITIVLLVLSLCYGPFVVTNLISAFLTDHVSGAVLTSLNMWSFILLFLNSSLNAAVFLYKHRSGTASIAQNIKVRYVGQHSVLNDSKCNKSRQAQSRIPVSGAITGTVD